MTYETMQSVSAMLGLFVFIGLFIAVLAFGLLYAWRKGALEWA